MALIQKIRSKSGLVLTLMVLAIVAFIGMLVMQDANPGGSSRGVFGNSTTVAKVAGKSLEIKDLERTGEAMYQGRGGDLQVRNSLFNFFVENALVTKEADAAGLGVCKDELLDLEFGQNISPAIMQNQALANPQTGQVDMQQLMQIKQAIQANTMPATGKAYWAEIEKQVIKDRLQTKLTNMAAKAIYTPTWLVDESYKDLTEPLDFEYVRVPFDRIEDKDVSITDADLENYISENKAKLTTDEETRTVEYVAVDVTPSVADSTKLRDKIASLKEGFRTAVKDSAFVAINNGTFAETFVNKEGVNATIKDSLFGGAIGSVFGPFVEGKAFTLAKLIDRKTSPDSVKSRHILIKTAPDAQKIADSLLAIINANPAMWDSLDNKFSTDQNAKLKGGDLGYQPQGMFVPTFNDFIFFKATQGKFYTLATQFGVHIIQVTGVKAGKNEARVKVAYVREAIIPSPETDRAAREKADDLLISAKTGEDLKKNAIQKGMQFQPSAPFRANDAQLGNFGQATGVRSLIRWAYEAKAGDRAKEVYAMQQTGEPYVSQYVVAAVKSISPKGVPSVANVREQLTPLVKNRKKGEALKAKIGTVSDLNALVGAYNTKIDTAKGVTFNATFVPNLGNESKVIGSAFNVPVGNISAPIVGESAVYVLKVVKREPLTNSPVDKKVLQQQLGGNMKQAIRGVLVRSLKKKADIVDNRSKFF